MVCFTGNNGSGKTNLLDAIHYLSVGKSYFHPIDQQNIHHGERFLRLEGNYEDEQGSRQQVVCVNEVGKRKQLSVNGVPDEKLTDHIGRFPVVVVAPDDIALINGGSEERRRFVDFLLSFTNREYLDTLVSYNKILQQRNAALKKMGETGRVEPTLLDVYDGQLAPAGNKLSAWRAGFTKDFVPLFQKEYVTIAGQNEQQEIIYQSDLLEETMEELLHNARYKDCRLQRTTLGTHRDDLQLWLGGHEVKKYGSQGQKKSFLIAMKLAAWEWLAAQSGKKPLLLLDDLFDKLDSSRSAHLLNWVSEHTEAQVFITHTEADHILSLFHDPDILIEHFKVVDGTIYHE